MKNKKNVVITYQKTGCYNDINRVGGNRRKKRWMASLYSFKIDCNCERKNRRDWLTLLSLLVLSSREMFLPFFPIKSDSQYRLCSWSSKFFFVFSPSTRNRVRSVMLKVIWLFSVVFIQRIGLVLRLNTLLLNSSLKSLSVSSSFCRHFSSTRKAYRSSTSDCSRIMLYEFSGMKQESSFNPRRLSERR